MTVYRLLLKAVIMSSSKKVNNLAKRVSSEYKQIVNPSCNGSSQTDNDIKDGCEQARHAEQTIKKQQMVHEHNLDIENSYCDIGQKKSHGIKMIVNNEYIPSLRSHDNLRNAMIIHEILSQPVCKRRKKR